LPLGLTLNAVTGVISGTPVQPSKAELFVLTASNAQGEAKANVTITVKEAAPTDLLYTEAAQEYLQFVAIPPNTPSYGGGKPTSYSAVPALPLGLSLNNNTGALEGTPEVFAERTTYTITAANGGGEATAVVVFTILEPRPFFSYATTEALYYRSIEVI
jgi:hypothetical protein